MGLFSFLFRIFRGHKRVPAIVWMTPRKMTNLTSDIENEFYGFLSLFSGKRNRRGMQYEFSDGKTVMVGESNRSLIIVALATAIMKVKADDDLHRVRSAIEMLKMAVEDCGGVPIKYKTPEKAKDFLPIEVNKKSLSIHVRAIHRLMTSDIDNKITLSDIAEHFYQVLRKSDSLA